MRTINYIVVHCTATPPTTTAGAIKKYWKEVRGWDKPGYHYLILRDGEAIQLLHEKQISCRTYPRHRECIHIAYIGGIDKEGKPFDNRTTAQKHSMFDKLVELSEKYPKAKIIGHRDFPGVKKSCPSFDVREWLRNYEPDFKQAA